MAESHAGIGTEADDYLGSPLHDALSFSVRLKSIRAFSLPVVSKQSSLL